MLEPTVRARALTPANGEPDRTVPSEFRLRTKHVGTPFRVWSPEVL